MNKYYQFSMCNGTLTSTPQLLMHDPKPTFELFITAASTGLGFDFYDPDHGPPEKLPSIAMFELKPNVIAKGGAIIYIYEFVGMR